MWAMMQGFKPTIATRIKTMPTELEQLRAQLEAEREARAAEVANYRRDLEAIRDQFPQDLWDKLRVPEIAVAALAAPPTAAVEAVEGMRKALEARDCTCEGWITCECGTYYVVNLHLCPKCFGRGSRFDRNTEKPRCARCAALAAYEEALRG